MKASRVGKVSLTGPQQRREFVPVWFSFMGLKRNYLVHMEGHVKCQQRPTVLQTNNLMSS